MPVIVLAGEEEFALSKRLSDLKASLLAPQWQTLNLIKLYKPSFESLQGSVDTFAFGGGNRIVLVENCDLFTKKKTKSDNGEETKTDATKNVKDAKSVNSVETQLEEILTSLPETTYLIFACPYNFDSTLKLAKLITKYGQLEEFPKEKYFPGSKNFKLESFCKQEAKKHGATIDDAAIEFLLTSTEGDLRQLVSEIEKTTLAILPQTKLTYEIVTNFCSPHSHIFQFIDFWLNGQKSKALDNLRDLLAQQNALPILATLQTMLSKWIKLKVLYEEYASYNKSTKGASPQHTDIVKRITADLKLMSYSVEKDLKRLKHFTAAQLIDKRLHLTRLEYSIKVGQIPADHALIMFVSSQ